MGRLIDVDKDSTLGGECDGVLRLLAAHEQEHEVASDGAPPDRKAPRRTPAVAGPRVGPVLAVGLSSQMTKIGVSIGVAYIDRALFQRLT